jgi:diguanylate cyclase (GGDEF)-like protein
MFVASLGNDYDAAVDLPVTVVQAEGDGLDPAQADHALLASLQEEKKFVSHNRQKPLWMRVELPANLTSDRWVLEFHILRFEHGRFWLVNESIDGSTEYLKIQPSPSIGRRTSSKGGFAFQLHGVEKPVAVIGEIRSYMPGRPKASLWPEGQFNASAETYERQGGALFGSLMILAAFSVLVAALVRDSTFLVFGAWLVLSLRISAINGGWDKHWLGINLDNQIYLAILRATIAAYAYFTVFLYRSLLGNRADNASLSIFFYALQQCFLILVFVCPFIDHLTFLHLFWTLAAFGLGALTLRIAHVLLTQRNRTVTLYALSWGSMAAGMATEIAAQSGALNHSLWINSQSSSVISVLLMGIALADKLRSERDARLRAQDQSLGYLRKYKENYNSMPVGLFGASESGGLVIYNPEFSRIARLISDEEIPGGHVDAYLGTGALNRIRASIALDVRELEFSLPGRDGATRWFLGRFSAKESTIEGSIQDITSRKLAEERLKHLVDHDSLTGLLNRRGLDAALHEALAQVRAGKRCAIAYVDLDRFKLFNDLHGHATGDMLLKEAARRLRESVRNGDVVARLADAFVVLFVDCPDHAVAGLTERIRLAIGTAPFEMEDKGLNLTASLGVVAIEPFMSTIDAVAAADRACAEAKSRGRNCVVRLGEQDGALKAHLEELRVVADLQQRTPTEKYFLEFQPIIALQSAMSSLSYEVLIRMRDDDGKVVPPGKFIGAAERNGLMSQIDRWVLRSTLEWLDDHPEHRDRLSFATINISGASLNDTRFVDDAFALIAEHPLAISKLCFEITESVALHDLRSTRQFVDRVRIYGSKLALDDFGAGYTSFNYLKEIPADFIKIDGSFVKDINRNPANYAITRTIVELTHELGMRSIAEWAETPDTIASLCHLRVDYGQGFGLVRPISPEHVAPVTSGGSLVRDPQVIELLDAHSRAAPTVRAPLATHRELR